MIGDDVKIQNNVSVYEGVTLEDDVFCGPSMVFTNVINPRSHVSLTCGATGASRRMLSSRDAHGSTLSCSCA